MTSDLQTDGGLPMRENPVMEPESAAPVESPCNGQCIIDLDTGFCEGCFRTMREIRKWTGYRQEERREVFRRIEARRNGCRDDPDE